MSVGVLVQFKSPDRQALYRPVASEGIYARYWVPAARRLGLPWLPEFQTGTTVPVDAMPAVIAEIEQVRAEFARRPDTARLLPRVDDILEALRVLDLAEVDDVFIG